MIMALIEAPKNSRDLIFEITTKPVEGIASRKLFNPSGNPSSRLSAFTSPTLVFTYPQGEVY